MRKSNYLWLMILVTGLFFSGCKPADNKLTDQEIADGWVLLFDGKTLDGWRDFKGEAGTVTAPWTVEKGTLTALGTGSDSTGYIVSGKEYGNFIITFDWKIAEGGNSGLLYHVVERPEYKVPYVTGPEYQLIDDAGFPDKLEEWQKAGADYAMYLPDNSKKQLAEVGDWNRSKIVFDNGHVEYWLNDQKLLEFEAWTEDWFTRRESGKWDFAPEYGLARSGVIALQDHGSRTWFKADYIRLKNVVLSYDFNPDIARKLKLSSARFFVQGTNLWTFSDWYSYDVEFVGPTNQVNGTGIIPQSKNITFGINVGF